MSEVEEYEDDFEDYDEASLIESVAEASARSSSVNSLRVASARNERAQIAAASPKAQNEASAAATIAAEAADSMMLKRIAQRQTTAAATTATIPTTHGQNARPTTSASRTFRFERTRPIDAEALLSGGGGVVARETLANGCGREFVGSIDVRPNRLFDLSRRQVGACAFWHCRRLQIAQRFTETADELAFNATQTTPRTRCDKQTQCGDILPSSLSSKRGAPRHFERLAGGGGGGNAERAATFLELAANVMTTLAACREPIDDTIVMPLRSKFTLGVGCRRFSIESDARKLRLRAATLAIGARFLGVACVAAAASGSRPSQLLVAFFAATDGAGRLVQQTIVDIHDLAADALVRSVRRRAERRVEEAIFPAV